MTTFTDTAWSSPESKLSAEDYAKVCLIDSNPSGKDKVKALCHLPVRSTPGGPVNKNGVHSAAGALAGARGGLKGVSPADKKSAARKLMSFYSEMKETPPDALKRIAGA